ncbi:SDR family NAD(P)-dependent oxidoreductase [Rhodanobacter lindaniclasticus]
MLITGAANGIGAAIAAMAAQQGHRVIAADRDSEALRARWRDHPAVQCEVLDVTDAAAWQVLVAKIEREVGALDVLINVADGAAQWPDRRTGTRGHRPHPRRQRARHDLRLQCRRRGDEAAPARPPHQHRFGGLAVRHAGHHDVRGQQVRGARLQRSRRPATCARTASPSPCSAPARSRPRCWSSSAATRNTALTYSGSRALSPEEVAAAVLGPVLRKRPLEYFLPFRDELLGKISNACPASSSASSTRRARVAGATSRRRTTTGALMHPITHFDGCRNAPRPAGPRRGTPAPPRSISAGTCWPGPGCATSNRST